MADAVVTVRAQAALYADGDLLCVRHRKADAAYLVLPGGHLESGETLWETVVREVREETGLEIEAGHLWALSEFRYRGRHVLDCTFFATAWGGRPRLGIDPDAAEHPATLVGLEWLSRDAFAEAPFRPTLLARWLRAHWQDAEAPATYLGLESA